MSWVNTGPFLHRNQYFFYDDFTFINGASGLATGNSIIGPYNANVTAAGTSSGVVRAGQVAAHASCMVLGTDDAVADFTMVAPGGTSAGGTNGVPCRFLAGKRMSWEARFALTDSADTAAAPTNVGPVIIGLYENAVATISNAASTAGFFCYKAAASATLTCFWSDGTTQLTVGTTTMGTAGTFKTVGGYYDGANSATFYVDGVPVSSINVSTALQHGTGANSVLVPKWGITEDATTNGLAAAALMPIDFVAAAIER
jgi:hypothetical protein